MYKPIIKGLEQHVSKEQAIVDLIESIALEETAVANIINAEGEKNDKMIKYGMSTEEIVKINQSMNDTIKNLIKLQMLLQFKLEYVKNIFKK